MKKQILLSIGIVLLALQVSAETIVNASIASNTTFTVSGSPYIIENNIEVKQGVTLTIGEGVTVKIAQGRYIHVLGSLVATGATFTGNNGITKGFWDGIYVSYNSSSYPEGSLTLTNCTVEFASNLYVRKGTMKATGCTFRNFSGSGVRLETAGTLNIDNTSITGTNWPITLVGPGKFNPGAGMSYTDNTNNYVDIDFRDIAGEFTLKNPGIPYFNDNEILVGENALLTIDSGVNINFRYVRMYVDGKVSALGTSDAPIVFGLYPNTHFYGIKMRAASAGKENVFKNCVFRNANYDAEDHEALSIYGGSPAFENCQFEGNTRNLLVRQGAPTFTNCTFGPSTVMSGEAYNIGMQVNASPEFNNCSLTFNDREFRAIRIVPTTVNTSSQLKKLSFTNFSNITYCIYSRTIIAPEGSLSVNPGVVIKFRDSNAVIEANGKMEAIGTVAEPIVFACLSDDGAGNPADTQNNGTQPIVRNSGGGIILNSASAVSKLERCKFNGMNGTSYWSLQVRNNNVVNNCDFMNTDASVSFAQNAKVTNCRFENITYPIGYIASQGSPDISGNTLLNTGYKGIVLQSITNDSPSLKKMSFAGQTNAPYFVTDGSTLTIDANNTLTIEPGVVIKTWCYWWSSYSFVVKGCLKALGTPEEKIVFTSILDDNAGGDTNNNGSGNVPGIGNWGGILFDNTNADNVLKNCEFSYTGYGDRMSVSFDNSKALVSGVSFNYATRAGIGIFGTSAPTIKDCTFNNITGCPVFMDISARPVFEGNNKVSNVGLVAFELRGVSSEGTVQAYNFAGYQSINYYTRETITVNNGSELTIPAGLTFKGQGRWEIKGKLNIAGTTDKPVVFTGIDDDSYGSPADVRLNGKSTPENNGGYFVFYDQANDASKISRAVFRYSQQSSVQLNNASPIIENSLFENLNTNGIVLYGTSTPAIENNTFNNTAMPMAISLLTYPRSTQGNSISGSSARAIGVIEETLSQNTTLVKRDFGGMKNIPYLFTNYTIGLGSKLTIEPGITCKFYGGTYINVKGALSAVGGDKPDQAIVFTTYLDDFYGGDTYGDGNTRTPDSGRWHGICFRNESTDADCVLKNCVFRYTYKPWWENFGAVAFHDASPNISFCKFDNNQMGLFSLGASQPTISNCDFVNWMEYAIYNSVPSNVITATNCWFNSDTGPTHATNPQGKGFKVTDGVAFTPFATGLGKYELGDVSMNGTINPYDASLILQHLVSNITLTTPQQTLADVSHNGGVSSYDASMILQYNVGLTTTFIPGPGEPWGEKSGMITNAAMAQIDFGNPKKSQNASEFTVPLVLGTGSKVKSLDLKLTFDPQHIQLLGCKTGKLPQGVTLAQSAKSDNGCLTFAIASAYDLGLNNDTIYLQFKIKDSSVAQSELKLTSAVANETVLTDHIRAITVGANTITGGNDLASARDMDIWITPEDIMIGLNIPAGTDKVSLKVFDMTGRELLHKIQAVISGGTQTFAINKSELGTYNTGAYIIQAIAGTNRFSKKIVVR